MGIEKITSYKKINSKPISLLEAIQEDLGDCRRCPLSKGRNKIVFGSGNPNAKLFFVGEGPGADEDTQGIPFVGQAGQLLTKIIEAMGYSRDEVYIANIVKCRPPQNRAPEPNEIAECSPFLMKQIESVRPSLIIALGSTAAMTLVGQATSMAELRGKFYPLIWNPNIPVLPTYHPAYLLRNPSAKRLVWDDMKIAKAKLLNT